MQEDMKGGNCSMCDTHGFRGGMCRQHHWMHIIIKILVALFIFWCGVQFGELKSLLHSGYYGMMSSRGEWGQIYRTPGMMGGWTYTTASGTTTTQKR